MGQSRTIHIVSTEHPDFPQQPNLLAMWERRTIASRGTLSIRDQTEMYLPESHATIAAEPLEHGDGRLSIGYLSRDQAVVSTDYSHTAGRVLALKMLRNVNFFTRERGAAFPMKPPALQVLLKLTVSTGLYDAPVQILQENQADAFSGVARRAIVTVLDPASLLDDSGHLRPVTSPPFEGRADKDSLRLAERDATVRQSSAVHSDDTLGQSSVRLSVPQSVHRWVASTHRPRRFVMPAFTSRQYRDSSDLNLLIEFSAKTAGARLPNATYLKPGDVVWGSYDPGHDLRADIRLWFRGSDLVAYAWFGSPEVSFDIAAGLPHYDAIGAEILEWGEERRRSVLKPGGDTLPIALAMLGGDTLSAIALSGDSERIALLERYGYQLTDRYSVYHSRSLTDAPIEIPKLDAGLRLRHATEADVDERAEAHRDAFSVWGPSRFTSANNRILRAAPLYDETLDIVLENADGKILSYCIGWFDAVNRVGHFEPVGTRPVFAGRGYARAAIFEALRRMQSRGAHTALVNTESVNPRARRTYLSCGFDEIDRAHAYTRKLG